MVHILVRHAVENFDAWHVGFVEDDARRVAGGQVGTPKLFRDVKSPNLVTILLDWSSADAAEKFVSDPALAQVMQKVGVVGMPEVVALLSPAG